MLESVLALKDLQKKTGLRGHWMVGKPEQSIKGAPKCSHSGCRWKCRGNVTCAKCHLFCPHGPRRGEHPHHEDVAREASRTLSFCPLPDCSRGGGGCSTNQQRRCSPHHPQLDSTAKRQVLRPSSRSKLLGVGSISDVGYQSMDAKKS